jgi:serine/threonine-protein kinase
LDGHPAEALKISQTSTHEVFRLHGAALAEYDLGHRQESERQLARLIDRYAFGAAYQVAEVYAWRGGKDRAFEWLQRARAQHDPGMLSLKIDPLLGKLNGDPRYAAMLRSVNL